MDLSTNCNNIFDINIIHVIIIAIFVVIVLIEIFTIHYHYHYYSYYYYHQVRPNLTSEELISIWMSNSIQKTSNQNC